MKKLIYLILLLPILLTGSKEKEQWHYELPFNVYDQNDSIPTINQFGQVRNGIIVDGIVAAMDADPSGVKLTRTELDYIRSIVGGLYVIGVWQKCVAVYGFVGGNAFKHKFNWKNPLDTDAAFRLTFVGGVTHSANGVQFNGTNNYANTFVKGVTDIPLNTNFLGCYNINPLIGNTTNMGYNTTTQLSISYSTTNLGANNYLAAAVGTIGSKTGLRINYRVSSTVHKHLVNGNIITFNATATSRDNQNIYIGGLNGGGSLLIAPSATLNNFAFIGNQALTDNQAIQTSRAVTFSQGILSRQ
jgi:hypothetical protein